ncbi:MAG: cysteine hydrolase family protein [Candidatus Dormibacterales bacterium]
MRRALLAAEPEPVELDLDRTAILVVDMQNAFASPGGMLDMAGVDIGGAGAAIERTGEVLEAARAGGVPVVYLVIGYDEALSNAGGPNSPHPRKELGLRLMREHTELAGKVLTFGTWDFAVVDALRPRPGETVIAKARYSGFAGTNLDAVLRGLGARHLLVTGTTSNVCVESTIRDAYSHEYWPVLVADATMAAGPDFVQRATVYNVSTFFGWVAKGADVAGALSGGPDPAG